MRRTLFILCIIIVFCNTLIQSAEPDIPQVDSQSYNEGVGFATMSVTTYKAGMALVSPGIFLTMSSLAVFAFKGYLEANFISVRPIGSDKDVEMEPPSMTFVTSGAFSMLGVGLTCDLISISLFIASEVFARKAKKSFGGNYPKDLPVHSRILPTHKKLMNAGIISLVNGSIGLVGGLACIIVNQAVIWYMETYTFSAFKDAIIQDQLDQGTPESELDVPIFNPDEFGKDQAIIAGSILLTAGIIIDITGIIMMSASYMVKQNSGIKNRYVFKPVIGMSNTDISFGCSVLL